MRLPNGLSPPSLHSPPQLHRRGMESRDYICGASDLPHCRPRFPSGSRHYGGLWLHCHRRPRSIVALLPPPFTRDFSPAPCVAPAFTLHLINLFYIVNTIFLLLSVVIYKCYTYKLWSRVSQPVTLPPHPTISLPHYAPCPALPCCPLVPLKFTPPF